MNRDRVVVHQAFLRSMPPNGRAFSGEPSEQSERPERMRGQRGRCNAMLGGAPNIPPAARAPRAQAEQNGT